ncbi:uncharacterized protein LOC133872510 isoform X2 [Alnus glutinosa]|uniref:uncharacterized protein LOC133872510 isoform X2 n=1 Tax=Alnus glutinosa TaxID=3517 RepID=UPI002D79B9A3|nr:uncharacterized protein LOC133872510 isoform X2 [Alnus glutinosa]XP_062166015.1 uncharacterized protein LOC133872510 isoform X2 [Alnus glutinosa]
MATVLKAPTIRVALPPRPTNSTSSKSEKPFCVSYRHSTPKHSRLSSLRFSRLPSLRFVKFVPFTSSGETETTDTQEEVQQPQQSKDILDGAVRNEDGTSDDVTGAEEVPASVIISLLQSYKEALASNDESRVAEIESLLKSVEDEKISLERKVNSLSEELSTEKDRILRIIADFDNFRKRTERERVSLLTNAQGEVVESLLPVLDNFERAKAQIKIETDGEEKVNNSYQSIYKQFMEILSSLGVVPVETIGNPFDPLVSYRVGLKSNRVLDELFQILNQVCSGFMKTWMRF